jgi:hypothetical protein
MVEKLCRFQASKRAARPDGSTRPGPGWPDPAQQDFPVGSSGPRFLSGRLGPTFLCFFFYFLSNFIPVISDRNY